MNSDRTLDIVNSWQIYIKFDDYQPHLKLKGKSPAYTKASNINLYYYHYPQVYKYKHIKIYT